MNNTSTTAPRTFASPFQNIQTRRGSNAFGPGEFAIVDGADPFARLKHLVDAAALAVKACEAAGNGTVLFAATDSSLDLDYLTYLFAQQGVSHSEHLRLRTARSASNLSLLVRTAVHAGHAPSVVFVESISDLAIMSEPAASARAHIAAQTLQYISLGDLDKAFESSSGLDLDAVSDTTGSAPLDAIPVIAGRRTNTAGDPWGGKAICAYADLTYDMDGRLTKSRHFC